MSRLSSRPCGFSQAKGGRRSASSTQERRLADDGCHTTPGSGNGPVKGDARGENVLIECKTTAAASYRLCESDLQKVHLQARTASRMAVLQTQFRNDPRSRYAVLRWDDFVELMREAGHPL